MGTVGTDREKCRFSQYLCGFKVYPLYTKISGYKVGTEGTKREEKAKMRGFKATKQPNHPELGDAAYQRVPHNFQEALEFSATGKIVVMGGTEPAHSTDAVSAILAEYVQADKLINLTSVDGMYTKDPNKFEDAELVPEITATDLLAFLSDKDVKAGTYEFFDTTAVQMIKRSDLETVITNGFEPENLIKAVNGEPIGTRIINE